MAKQDSDKKPVCVNEIITSLNGPGQMFDFYFCVENIKLQLKTR